MPTPTVITTQHIKGCRVQGGTVPPWKCPRCTAPADAKLVGYLMRLDRLAGGR